MTARWQFWIDRGGTFTDIVARAPDGGLHTRKLLSAHPELYEDAAVEGIRRVLGLARDQRIAPEQVESVKMGTTVATNALLERRGERTVLVTTRGFRDALRIATQARPRLFDRRLVLPELLYERVIEAHERIGAQGEVLVALDQAGLAAELQRAYVAGARACAIVFLHGYRFTAHESAAESLARAAGFTQVSVSNRVSPLMKLVPRGDTTVVDAYLSPVLRRYVDRLAHHMPGVRLLFMQSSGGLTEASRFQGKDAILSGPAAGIVGMVCTGRAAGHERLIGFDMGGTSTDVSHYAGQYERAFDTEVAGVRMRAPMMNIHTIAAGGGSLVRFEDGRLRVGPASAGANPGPACYRRGGPLTITDANLLLGRIRSDYFPRVFGPDGCLALDVDVVVQRFGELAVLMTRLIGRTVTPEEAASGSLDIAVGNMANAVKRISVARGYDVTAYTLQCFGGAGGQLACRVADALGMRRVLCHPMAGVMSAFGMGFADQHALREASVECALNEVGVRAAQRAALHLVAEAHAELSAQGGVSIRSRAEVRVRYQGTDTALPCELSLTALTDADALPACDAIRAAFEVAYRQRFAFLMPAAALVIEAVLVQCVAPGPRPLSADAATEGVAYRPDPRAEIDMYCFADDAQPAWRRAALYLRESLHAGALIDGPAVLVEPNATTVVEPGWRAQRVPGGSVEMRRISERGGALSRGAAADPVRLEVFNNLFMNIAEQMGLRLQSSAHSVNIKERLDFSCALFDAAGALIANAPHIPVHLGSMSDSIRCVMRRNPGMQAGDVFALNDPYNGGTHLPDVTVVTPVFLGDGPPKFYVASRGHHADIGGITPGSMPPFSTGIEEEGVLIDNFPLVVDGEFREASVRALLASGAHPARNPDQNVADLRAQIAANEKGQQELARLVLQYGHPTVAQYMQHVQDNAEACVRQVIGTLRDGEFTLPLDNGARIRVAVRIGTDGRACIDFTGTSAQLPNNFNAPRAITVAAVLYVFRTLVQQDIPLNAGCLKPLDLIVPAGCMLNPVWPAAVVAGNVETSMCVTNALYGALGVMAASQCTMNNFTFGNTRHQYYETIAGGSGAGPGYDGTSVVQTHMTNSRLTVPVLLEFRFPVRVDGYEIRPHSGGVGEWTGGNGGERRIRFLEPMTAAILSNGRRHGAFGMAGGRAGVVGHNSIERADGRVDVLGAIGQADMAVDDVFVIRTPGGGGYGRRES